MTVDYEVQSIWEWLAPTATSLGAGAQFLFTVFTLCLLGLLLGYAGSVLRHGFQEGFYRLAMAVVSAPSDFLRMAPGRIAGMARLAMQEAIRRRILIVFGIFVVLLLVAGWYLDQKSDRPAEIYLSFVLTATNFLILVMALFVSVFSLPSSIKTRTIYTVVTKPIYACEIVLGNILGFSIVGTGLLVMMGTVSYFFVVRGLSHRHTITADAAQLNEEGLWEGETEFSNHHNHTFLVGEDGVGETDRVMQHWHVVEKTDDGFVVGPAEGLPPRGRVPLYGKLRFLNRAGTEGEGVSVGYEWGYRKYIEGGTLAAAIWTFEGVNESNFPDDGIPLELNLSVFRTYKGEIERGIVGEIILRNPDTSATIRASSPITFTAKEFEIDEKFIPRKLSATSVEEATPIEVDLFDDLAPDGRLEVMIRCAERSQYYGMSRYDAYLKPKDRPFLVNLAKGYFGIWMQMIIVISLGVMFSTFLSGPVAMVATVSSVVMGVFARFIAGVFGEQFDNNPFLTRLFGTFADKGEGVLGGGPIEALIRLLMQLNLTIDLDFHPALLTIIEWADLLLMGMLYTVTQVLPDFRLLNRASNVASGYDIPSQLLVQHGLTTLAFFLFLWIAGYFFLKTREIAA